ncbi:MAG: hypothetical protein AAB817_00710 [Patescibacteria group bacterium]
MTQRQRGDGKGGPPSRPKQHDGKPSYQDQARARFQEIKAGYIKALEKDEDDWLQHVVAKNVGYFDGRGRWQRGTLTSIELRMIVEGSPFRLEDIFEAALGTFEHLTKRLRAGRVYQILALTVLRLIGEQWEKSQAAADDGAVDDEDAATDDEDDEDDEDAAGAATGS